MKKIKELYNKNRVLFILTCIMIVCVLVIVIGIISSLFMGKGSNKYGNRLDNIKGIKISNSEQNKIASAFESDENVESTKLKVVGKIVYVTIDVTERTKVNTAKTIANKGLKEFSDDEVSNYDIQFIITCKSNEKSSIYPTMGYKNANSKNISWINRNEK